MRIVLFKGQSQYGSLRLHVDQLAAALRDLGHEAVVVDLAADDPIAAVNAVLADPPGAFFGFSGVGCDLQADGRSIFDALGAVYASLYVDHPLHHLPRLSTPIQRKVALFLDRSHVQFMSVWSEGRTFRQIGFLPCGANQLGEPPDTTDAAFASRDIPLLFTGTYRGPPLAPWKEWPHSPAKDLVLDVAGQMCADGRLSILDALKQSLARQGGGLTSELLDQVAPLLQAVQAYCEAYHRDRLLNILGAARVPIRVYGAGWEPLTTQYPSFDYGGVGSFAETLALLRRTRLVLNTNNGFVAGGHERVFTAMSAGAAVLSDQSRYYAEAFKDGREIATFAWDALEDVPQQIETLLADEAGLAALARSGAKKALAEHQWRDRAARLVKTLKLAR
ncbi:glycosyltransferase [Phenylobacterium sp.]|uniref:glycosyltransferase family protein n=1 Tax=Phenylobacterium sp. TaxID=1871053 RepID=UPI0027303506|nr:glycosyltransferase [Phenylobacterium sp.]MDP1873297.1 glycosyltransferase [Phenylobacterium sp.]